MIEDKSQPVPSAPALPQLYVFGSCESDQYYHPRHEMQSKRPICLTDIETFELGQDQDDEQPKKIPNPLFRASILKIACGGLHTVVATTQGQVFTFGCNDEGALGRQGPQKIPLPVLLQDDSIDHISAGDNHSVFASSRACTVYFTGNYKFMRGQKMAQPIRHPIKYTTSQITNRSKYGQLQKLASGSNHTAILIDGRIYVRGQPQAHTVGRRINQRHKVQMSLMFDGIGLTGVEDMWCGGYHTIAKIKKAKGFQYYGWGINRHGQLGTGSYEQSPYPIQIKKLRGKDVRQVAAGTNFTIFLLEGGEVMGCGQNDQGQLGLGDGYQYVDSEEEEEKKLEEEIKQKMSLRQAQSQQLAVNAGQQVRQHKMGQKKHQSQCQQQNVQQKPKNLQQNQLNLQKKQQQPAYNPQPLPQQPKKLIQQNIYIKTIKKIPLPQPLLHISTGSQFVYGWNQTNLYSWGFGMNYVLLNGNEQNQTQPFRVKSKIINQHGIYQLEAGAQHVAYLSYTREKGKPSPVLSERAKQVADQSRMKLSRRRKTSKK